MNSKAVKTVLLAGAAMPYALLMASRGQLPAASYSKDVAPIFKAHCISCHSGAAAAAKLDLSSPDSIRKGGASGALWVPGQPGSSLLMKRITEGGESQMPLGMPGLSAAEIRTVSNWVKAGGNFDTTSAPKHWAYVAPVRPIVPKLNSSWVQNPVDAFILEKLRLEHLHPSPQASKETLIRRLSLDLVGLPPTLEDVTSFVHDKRPDAYERLVDRLLASNHYGERQARGWLDLARYADSNGYEKDLSRMAWAYRDWVIDAFNQNMPFDQFTIKQLAGDLLPNGSIQDKVATGFNRNTMFNQEGGVNQEEAHFAVITDRVDTTASVWLGTTLQCARCHDHKYDPFSQRDYYKMAAFFSHTRINPQGPKDVGEEKWFEPVISVPSDDQIREGQTLRAQIARQIEQEQARTPEIDAAFERWQAQAVKNVGWSRIVPMSATSESGDPMSIDSEGVVTQAGTAPVTDLFTVAFTTDKPVRALRFRAIASDGHGPGRGDNGNFVLTGVELTSNSEPVKLVSAVADFSQEGFDASTALDPSAKAGWAVMPKLTESHVISFGLASALPANSQVILKLAFHSPYPRHVVGKFQLLETDREDALSPPLPADIATLLAKHDKSPEELKKLFDYFQTFSSLFATTRRRIREAQVSLEQLNASIPTALVMEEGQTSGPLTEFVRHRGEFQAKTEKVEAGTPAILPAAGSGFQNRLSLARWIVSKNNPLTARVEVNRIWEQLFGRGIVETSEDFGTRGSPPVNQKLLDWLACEFAGNGWNMKAITKLIVMSSTYRQSSDATPALMAKDPENLYLARAPRIRLEAELIHDAVLSESGLLNEKIGGPSVYPYQPDGIWDSPYSGETWRTSMNGDGYRRGIYTFWKRTAPYPMFTTFDATSREFCTVRRIRTNTPLQALALLNDKLMIQASQALGNRMMKSAQDDKRRLVEGFELCTSREPSTVELSRLQQLLAKLESRYRAKPKQAAILGPTPDSAAYAMVGNVLLNLDEAITKE